MKEIWLPVIDQRIKTGLYEVSNLSRVKSLPHKRFGKNKFGGFYRNYPEKIMRQTFNQRYFYVGLLGVDGKQKQCRVHRLVAQSFIPNPDNLPEVLHRDDNTSNNRVENLFWGTQSDNIKDCVEKGRYHFPNPKRAVIAIAADGRKTKYESQSEAARQTDVLQSDISACCRGLQKTAGGLIWKYAND